LVRNHGVLRESVAARDRGSNGFGGGSGKRFALSVASRNDGSRERGCRGDGAVVVAGSCPLPIPLRNERKRSAQPWRSVVRAAGGCLRRMLLAGAKRESRRSAGGFARGVRGPQDTERAPAKGTIWLRKTFILLESVYGASLPRGESRGHSP